jgi:transposase
MEIFMEQFVGLDVSQEVTHLCVADIKGEIVWQGKCLSTPDAIADMIKAKAPTVARIGLESGPLSTWHWHALNAMGFPVVCLDARHAKAALSMQVNKTDKNDAHGLAQIVRTGWYREVSVKSLDSHTVRSMLGVRAQLVGMRVEIMNQTRGILKTFGIVMSGKPGMSFEQRAEELIEGAGLLQGALRSLLAVLRSIGEQVAVLDQRVRQYTRKSKVCRQLMTIPGVGPLTAAAFVTTVDDPAKFRKSKTVGAYLGLTPRRYQSGETDHNGGISKCGDHLTRTYLFEAAGTLLTRVEKWSSLKAWGLRLAKRIGMKKAKVAVARKLAVIMHRMWVDGGAFRWSDAEPAIAAA